MHYAAYNDNRELCRFLIDEHKAQVDRYSERKDTPLLKYLERQRDNNYLLGHYLVSKGADINIYCGLYSKDTPLHRAVKQKNIPWVSNNEKSF